MQTWFTQGEAIFPVHVVKMELYLLTDINGKTLNLVHLSLSSSVPWYLIS